MINTPFEDDVSANITTNLIASPIDDDSASGTNPITEDINKDYLYTTKVDDRDLTGNIRTKLYIYDNYQDALNDLYRQDERVYRKLLMNGDTIDKKYIVQELYRRVSIQYGVDESSLDITPVFNKNVEELQIAYGTNNCTLSTNEIICHKNAFYANVKKNGRAWLQENNVGCDESICSSSFPTQ